MNAPSTVRAASGYETRTASEILSQIRSTQRKAGALMEKLWKGHADGSLCASDIRARLHAAACEAHEGLPQYAGHWDGWALVRVKRAMTTKAGVLFQDGDYALARFDRVNRPGAVGKVTTVTVYSVRGAIDAGGLEPWEVEVIPTR